MPAMSYFFFKKNNSKKLKTTDECGPQGRDEEEWDLITCACGGGRRQGDGRDTAGLKVSTYFQETKTTTSHYSLSI